jgi:hypothetical protein
MGVDHDYTAFYLREAQRLKDLAEVFVCADTREQMARLIHRYEIMAGRMLDGRPLPAEDRSAARA